MKQKSMYNGLRLTAIVLLFLVSFNALAAGYGFITDPSGGGLGISPNYLRQSAPFNDYFICRIRTIVGSSSLLVEA